MRSPGRIAVVVAGVITLTLVVGASTGRATGSAPSSATAANASVATKAIETPRGHHLFFGLTIPDLPTGNPASMEALDTRESQLNHTATIVSYYQSWSSPFDSLAATNVWDQGALPMLAWDPYNPKHTSSPYQKNWTLAQILSGRYDNYIRTTATQMAALDFPIALRIAHEQNGDWYPWGVHVRTPSGRRVNTAAQYRAVWRHVWRIFHAAHAKNVIFVWSPNAPNHAHPSLASTYPGGKYVDWAAVSAYMYSATSWHYIGRALKALRHAAPNKPAIIAETGVGKPTHAKARGIAHILSHVLTTPGLDGWVYLDSSHGRSDWRFETNPKALATLRHGLQNKHYYSALPLPRS